MLGAHELVARCPVLGAAEQRARLNQSLHLDIGRLVGAIRGVPDAAVHAAPLRRCRTRC